ncbi:replication factor A2 [Geosmithia morbida]|uniref:Replication factor A2 n=1 Tax=Geosmithia morbida TaxID=1094350 RepID=A0A9P4Z200_9HYPO|nr:replication factor A2 [Geosmithia morbida]KAF4126687.1 replication factor A2 [Geosmithia morbida]
MSAYGGYSTTGDESGGYFAGGSQQGSQGGGGGKNYQDESLRPVTVKQILDAEEAFNGGEFKIDNQAVTQVTVVGQVNNFKQQPTNITITLDDGTGQIDVKKFIDVDKQDEASNPGFQIGSHVRAWGRLKSFSGKRYISAHLIRPISDFNEVNYHMLEATYVHLFFTRGQPGANGAGGDGMFVDGGGGGAGAGAGGDSNPVISGKLSGCTPGAKRVYNFITNAPGGNEGCVRS